MAHFAPCPDARRRPNFAAFVAPASHGLLWACLALCALGGACWSGGNTGTSHAPSAGDGVVASSAQAGTDDGGRGTDVQEIGGSAAIPSTTPATTTPATPASPTVPTTVPATLPPATPVAAPPLPNPIPGLTVIGRADTTDPAGAKFALCNSRIGVHFSGPSLAVSLKGTGQDAWQVWIDNVATKVVTTVPNQATTFTLADNLAAGEHVAWLAKMTEFSQGSGTDAGITQFLGFTYGPGGAQLSPPAARARRLDFIGDSGFTGYGAGQLVTKSSEDCGYLPSTQNATTSVPQYTADLLNAEFMNMSWSGKAIARSIYDSNPRNMLPVIYDEISPPRATPPWDFSQWVADAVIINGGGNDVFNAQNPGQEYFPDPALFTSNYLSWLQRIRKVYPKALIVVMLTHAASGSNAKFLGDALRAVVAAANQAGDSQVMYFGYFDNDPTYHSYDEAASQLKLYWGCRKHPSPAGAQWLAQRLAAFLAAHLGN